MKKWHASILAIMAAPIAAAVIIHLPKITADPDTVLLIPGILLTALGLMAMLIFTLIAIEAHNNRLDDLKQENGQKARKQPEERDRDIRNCQYALIASATAVTIGAALFSARVFFEMNP